MYTFVYTLRADTGDICKGVGLSWLILRFLGQVVHTLPIEDFDMAAP